MEIYIALIPFSIACNFLDAIDPNHHKNNVQNQSLRHNFHEIIQKHGWLSGEIGLVCEFWIGAFSMIEFKK